MLPTETNASEPMTTASDETMAMNFIFYYYISDDGCVGGGTRRSCELLEEGNIYGSQIVPFEMDRCESGPQ